MSLVEIEENQKFNPFNNIKSRYLFIILCVNIFIMGEVSPISEDKLINEIFSSLIIYGTPYFYIKINLEKNNIFLNHLFLNTGNKIKLIDLTILSINIIAFSFGIVILQLYILNFVSPYLVNRLLNDETLLDSTKVSNIYIYNLFLFVKSVIIAPIVEEIFFRGFLINRFFTKFGIKKAVIYSSIIFGLFHADIFGAFIFAFFMSIIYLKTRNLWFTIYCHFLNNFVLEIMGSYEFIYGEKIPQNNITFTNEDIFYALSLLILSLPFLIKYFKGTNFKKLLNFSYKTAKT
jgi:membrane protease YdiL (CAAX protease family)